MKHLEAGFQNNQTVPIAIFFLSFTKQLDSILDISFHENIKKPTNIEQGLVVVVVVKGGEAVN